MNFFHRKPKHQWTPAQAPTAQTAYINTRQQELQAERDVNVRAALEVLDEDLAQWVLRRTPTMRELREAYQKIHTSLQHADLTINFDARSWFSSDNRYETYAQMYERAVGQDGKLRLVNDPLNPVSARTAADDRVTIPREWEQTQAVTRGLAPGQGQVRIAQRMLFKNTVNVGKTERNQTQFDSSNPHFDPKSKQVFAALNFGRRPHGSSCTYGWSFLVLQPHYKTNAFFFPGDTFGLASQRTQTQVNFAQIATLYGKLKRVVDRENDRQDLIKTCYHGIPVIDENEPTMLLEAHLFTEVRFAEALQSVNICRRIRAHAREKPFTDPEWDVIQANAKKFAKRWGAKLNVLP